MYGLGFTEAILMSPHKKFLAFVGLWLINPKLIPLD